MFDFHAFYIVLISGAILFFLRLLPFVAFMKKRPEFILYLGRVLPYSVMAMLVVYCLKDVNFLEYSHGLPEIISSVVVILLHIWKRNTLLSITSGTLLYMFLVQTIF